MNNMDNTGIPTDGLKRLRVLKQVLREHIRDRLGELAEEIYTKGYDFENYPALFKISFAGSNTVARIDYHKGEIHFNRVFTADASNPAKFIAELKDMLFYKPILDAVGEKIAALPYFFDASGDVLDELSEKTVLPEQTIEDRTIVEKVELTAEDIETVVTILEQSDFPGLFADYSADVMSSYITNEAPAL